MDDITVIPVAATHPELIALVADQQAEVTARYGGSEPDPELSVEATFLLLRVAGVPVGCVALQPLEPGVVAELKRMYIVPAYRRTGLGRLLLAEFEQAAAASGYTSVRLETGDAQPEALRLYETSGWHRIRPYGHWKDSPRSICFEKRLPSTRS